MQFTETWTAPDSLDLDADQDWTEIGDANNGGIVSNQVRNAAGGNCIARCEVDLSLVNHYAQGVVGASEETGSTPGGVCVRFASAALTYYAAFAEFDLNQVEIYKIIAGSYTLVASGAVTLNAGTTYLLRLAVDGSNLVAKIDGATIASGSDSAITEGTRTGIELGKDISGFTSIDDFEAGDIEPPTGVAKAYYQNFPKHKLRQPVPAGRVI